MQRDNDAIGDEAMPPPLTAARAVFLSPVPPRHVLGENSGIERRFRLLAEAVRACVNAVDFIFMVDAETARKVDEVTADLQADLEQTLGGTLSVTLVPRSTASTASRSFARRYWAPVLDAQRQPMIAPFTGRSPLLNLAAIIQAKRPDFIFAQRLSCAAPLVRLAEGGEIPPLFFDLDDIEHIAFWRAIAQPPRWLSKRLLYLQLPALIHLERRALRLARRAFVCSEADRDHLARHLGSRNVDVVPNALLAPSNVTPPAAEPALLFVGTYGYAPNRHAIEHFLDHIWPLIRRKVPTAEIVLAGARPELLRHHANPPPGTRFAGYVDDLSLLYAASRVVVCPLLSGGGTRVKIIEAATYARAVVATAIGAEGLSFASEEEILIRDTDESFAAGCVELLCDSERCRRMGAAARRRSDANYTRALAVGNLTRIMHRTLAAGASSAGDSRKPRA